MAGESKPPPHGRFARTAALTLTYATKAVGLASAFNQLLLQSSPKALPLGVAAFMMAGAQLSEGLLLSLLDRFMVLPEEPAPRRKPAPKKRREEGE